LDKIDPDSFALAVASVVVKKNTLSDSYSIFVVECNELFSELTSIGADRDRNLVDVVFPEGSVEPAELYRMQNQAEKGEKILNFNITGKSLLTRISPVGSEYLKFVCVDYTSIQRQLNSFSMQKIGYQKYIENFHGMAFQRMTKPVIKSVFTAGAYEEITGYSADQAKDFLSWLEIVHPEDQERVRQGSVELYDHRGTKMEMEYRIIKKDGEIRWVHSYDNHFLSEDEKMQMVQGLIVDVTDFKNQEFELQEANKKIQKQNEKLEEMSMTDHLTGLSNRRAMQQVLEYLIDDYKRTKESFCILMIDLDDFKKINDRFGHDAGDAVLCGISRIFSEVLRKIDFKCRWGGEEFLISLPRTNEKTGIKIGEKLLETVRSTAIEHHNIDIQMSFSAGLAFYNRNISLESLIKEADRALYKAKNSGKGKICVI